MGLFGSILDALFKVEERRYDGEGEEPVVLVRTESRTVVSGQEREGALDRYYQEPSRAVPDEDQGVALKTVLPVLASFGLTTAMGLYLTRERPRERMPSLRELYPEFFATNPAGLSTTAPVSREPAAVREPAPSPRDDYDYGEDALDIPRFQEAPGAPSPSPSRGPSGPPRGPAPAIGGGGFRITRSALAGPPKEGT